MKRIVQSYITSNGGMCCYSGRTNTLFVTKKPVIRDTCFIFTLSGLKRVPITLESKLANEFGKLPFTIVNE
jgi:hypothetical protein